MTRKQEIEELVAALDQENSNDADLAQWKLIEGYGKDALEPLLAAAPAFADYGRLCAIEVFNAIGDRRAGPVLIPWITSDHPLVREWTAGALGYLGITEAVPELLAGWEATKQRGTPPEYTEPVCFRQVLAELGAREIVLPDAIRRQTIDDDWLKPAWPAAAIRGVLDHLADAHQVVLYTQYFRREPNLDPKNWYWVNVGATAELDWTLQWEAIVTAAHDQMVAAADAKARKLPRRTVVTVEWIDRRDVPPATT